MQNGVYTIASGAVPVGVSILNGLVPGSKAK